MPEPRLLLDGIEKRFGRNIVLRDVTLSVGSGEVVALMGANGAGKTTLVKIVGGVYRADGGSITLEGRRFAPGSPTEALRHGVIIVHQLINDGVVPDLTVAENLVIDRFCTGDAPWYFSRRAAREQARAVADRLGLELDLKRPIRDLTLAERQLVAVARALAHHPKILILDEPTSSLSGAEADRLFAVIDRLRDEGVGILYISHKLADIRRLADRVVALRDGRITGSFERPFDVSAAVTAMLGHAVSGSTHTAARAGDTVLRFRDLVLMPGARPFTNAVRAGQITALVGLIGSGKTELAECLFGLRRPAGGRIEYRGAPYKVGGPGAAIERGVFMASEDRATTSLVPDFNIFKTMDLPFLDRFSRSGVINVGDERAAARRQIEGLSIRCQSEREAVTALSGGNQQKVVLGRWLSQPSLLLILDEPFQGVDIGSRQDIGQSLRATATKRATMILTADLDEAMEVADRILVMANGSVVGEHGIDGIDRAAVVAQMAEGDAAGRSAA